MSRVYDNWERLVGAVLDREKLRELALCESFSSSISADFSSRFSFDSTLGDGPASRISSDTIGPGAPSSTSTLFFCEEQPILFKELKKATRNFHPDLMLGEGGFGCVYKGWVDEQTLTATKPGFGMAIAVKRRKPHSLQGYPQWRKELDYLSKLRHPNLVKLVGYCDKEDKMCLVYEFMAKGSLDNHLFGRGHESLSWATRIKVATDVARGLSFLHDLEKPVIHRDVKSGDILLDGEFNAKLSDFNAKLSDFGLAVDDPTSDMTHVSTRVIMGTYGYAAPEYIMTGHLTAKCDVYGFGVVLLELLSGRRAIDKSRPTGEHNLVEWAKPFLGNKRKLKRIMDSKLEGQCPHEGAFKVATLALECVGPDPELRPPMAEVLAPLERL